MLENHLMYVYVFMYILVNYANFINLISIFVFNKLLK